MLATADTTVYAMVLKAMGFSPSSSPLIGIKDFATDNSYPFTEDRKEAGLAEFIALWSKGAIPAYRRSQPIPDPQEVDGLTTVVGRTWEDVTLNKNNDVLIAQCPVCIV